eukprot:m51a1_g14634 hypothetical protein (187) ;mRNA; r:37910-38591
MSEEEKRLQRLLRLVSRKAALLSLRSVQVQDRPRLAHAEAAAQALLLALDALGSAAPALAPPAPLPRPRSVSEPPPADPAPRSRSISDPPTAVSLLSPRSPIRVPYTSPGRCAVLVDSGEVQPLDLSAGYASASAGVTLARSPSPLLLPLALAPLKDSRGPGPRSPRVILPINLGVSTAPTKPSTR